MDINFDKIIEMYGIKGILFSFSIVIVTGILKSKWFTNLWARISDRVIDWFLKSKSTKYDVKEVDVLNHDIFNYIDFWINSKIPTFKFSTDYRTVVFRKYLILYLRCYKNEITNFVRSGEYKSMEHAELSKSLLNLINSIVSNYEHECEKAGIPNVVINKMKEKNNDIIQLIIDLIESISNSHFYESGENYLKLYSVLNIILSVLENSILNSESVCDSINGELKGLSFSDNGRIYNEP